MAVAEGASRTQVDKPGRSKLFSWMKRLTKTRSQTRRNQQQNRDAQNHQSPSASGSEKPSQSRTTAPTQEQTQKALHHGVATDGQYSGPSYIASGRNHEAQLDNGYEADGAGARSLAPTLATTAGTINSEGVGPHEADCNSKADTGNTATGGRVSLRSAGGGNSIFSASDHSAHSLATTLTTMQSGPPPLLQGGGASTVSSAATATAHTSVYANGINAQHQQHHQFSPGYPSGAPASAIPPYLVPHVPATYRSATANNLLSDNASVLTLASSSHRPHRRNSLDTNASIRAIAPSSNYGGSRESLPLSVLSQHPADAGVTSTPPPSAGLVAPSGGTSSRVVSGIGAPMHSSERNSLYTVKTSATGRGDGDSVRSGTLGHGRNDSTAGSINAGGGTFSSPLNASLGAELSQHDGDKME